MTGEFLSQRANNAENVSIWWRHHAGQNGCDRAYPIVMMFYFKLFGGICFHINQISITMASNYDVVWAPYDLLNHHYTVCSTACSRLQQRKHQSSPLLVLCEENPQVTTGRCPLKKGQQCGKRSLVMTSYAVVLKGVNFIIVNTLKPTQNGRHFAYDILKCIFLNFVWISIQIQLQLVPNGPIKYHSIGLDNGLAPTSHYLN